MPTDEIIAIDSYIDWPIATPEDEVRDRIRSRARVIKAQRRVPIGLAALAIVTAVALSTSLGAGQQSNLRTAGQDGSPYLVDEDRTVEAGGAKANARAKVRSHPTGGKVGAGTGADTPSGPVGIEGPGVAMNEDAAVPLTGHPLYSDPAGDAGSHRVGDRHSATDTRDSIESPASNYAAADVTAGDVQLEGDDTLVFRTTVVDLSSFRTRGDEHADDLLQFNVYAKAHGDVDLSINVTVDATLAVIDSIAGISNGLETAYVPITTEVDEEGSSMIIRITMTDFNEATRDPSFSNRSADGDITLSRGTHLSGLETHMVISPANAVEMGLPPEDYARPPSYSYYWAIGD